MGDYADETTEIRETDIIFDCPYCGKSLAIDYRGAGLNVRCPDCGRNLQVPIPEGMEIADVDSTREEQVVRMRNLRKALTEAEERIRELEIELARFRAASPGPDPSPAAQPAGFRYVLENTAQRIRKAVKEIEEALDTLREATEASGELPPESQS